MTGLRLRSLLIGLALTALGAVTWAQALEPTARVLIVSSDGATGYTQADEAITDNLLRQGLTRGDIGHCSAAELALRIKAGQAPHPAIFVALGSEATQLLAAGNVPAPVLSALIPGRSFERILRSSGRRISAQLSAIVLDQPLLRQLNLIHLALPQARRLAVLLGPDSQDKLASLRSLSASFGLTLKDAQVLVPEDLSRNLPALLDDSEVLLALADPLVFNSSSIQNILLASFRVHVPMLAFSPAYVRAGAVLAVYATPVQVGNQAAELVLGMLRGKPLPDRLIEPNDFEVGVNPHVARALGLGPDAETLRLAMRRLEHLP